MSEKPANIGENGVAIEDAVQIEIEVEERVEVLILAASGGQKHAEMIRERLEFDADVRLFERDCDEPFEHAEHGRRHVRIVGHKCHEVTLKVHYEHHTKEHHFRPSATVFKALQWAIGKHGYSLDPMAAAKANLILPDADLPLPREDVLGKYVKPGHCTLVVNLTLKDFSNG
jgi:hypothetical protein